MSRTTPRLALLLLGAACTGGAPPSASPTPSPTAAAEAAVPEGGGTRETSAIRYPRSGGGTARYRFHRRDSIEVTMPSGEAQLQVVGTTAYLTLTWTAADSGTRIEAKVDSLVPDPEAAAPYAQLDSARQAGWALRQAPDGEITGVVGQPSAFRADQIRDQLFLLFPILPPGGVRDGAEWTDSTTAPTRVSAFPGESRVEVRSIAARHPEGGLFLTIRRDRTVAGEGTQFGQAISVSATGADSLTTRLAPDGQVLETEGKRVTDLVVELSAIGQSVPAREVSFLRMTLLR